MCIVCSRCVRACDEVQGTFALTIQGRGFASKVSASQNEPFLASECVSCGACVEACPTVALSRSRSPSRASGPGGNDDVRDTAASAARSRPRLKGDQVVRMAPNRDGHANHGHACVKGRFAYGYATHPDRITTPMIRKSIDEPWRKVRWDEAIGHAAREFRRIQAKYGRDSIGGITSSRCTNEETFLVQKLVRAAFGNNNVDTCARVCHSPTGYGLKNTIGESAGTQAFDSVMKADVIIVVGANPTEGHPVFASQLKRRLRQGAKLIVVDPARDRARAGPRTSRPTSPAAAARHERRAVQRDRARRRDGGPDQRAVRRRAVRGRVVQQWKAFVAEERNSPEATASSPASSPTWCGARRASTPPPATARSTTVSASPSTARARRW